MIKLILFFLFLSLIAPAQEIYRLQINRLNIPFDNTGIIADVYDFGEPGGYLDDKSFLFSAGFFLSGLNADTIWANAVASASRIQDYQPGNVDSSQYDPRYINYVVSKWDLPFGDSWQKWRFAVILGADFYDGDGDGIFNPVDLNGNNQWDPNEDKPDMIGDITAWSVYNDGIPDSIRKFLNKPLGIEIQQTVFAFSSNNNNYNPNSTSFFVRYKIINTGKVSEVFDSVYFSGWADTDLGEENDAVYDDLAGCDTLLNSGYIYNDGDDPDWGVNPPAHFIKILQGPHSYIPGETFIDNNFNGEYDEEIDTPLDTAYNFKGVIGIDTLQGAKNLGLSSFTHYMKSTPLELSDPGTHLDARNYMLGGVNKFGEPIDPCTWFFGNVYGGVPCEQINPKFIYSGDPVANTGWLNNFGTDQRQMTNAGPFKLKEGEPVTIIIAHIAARGYDHLNSVTRGRIFSSSLDDFLRSNFIDIPVYVDDEITAQILSSFQLYQNYPNPFNPVTKIKYTIPSVTLSEVEGSLVSLKIFDLLGNEIATLVNKEQPEGNYEVEFDGRNLSSGIYFYKLRTGSFIQTKKMILLK